MQNLDFLFFAATLAFGWGLSLATYRIFAVRNDWPMGELHASKPLVPVLLGVFSIAIAFLFAAFRAVSEASALGGWWVLPAGLLWAVFWIGFMRVGAQVSLILAPLATTALLVAWISVRSPPEQYLNSDYQPTSLSFGSGGTGEGSLARRSTNMGRGDVRRNIDALNGFRRDN